MERLRVGARTAGQISAGRVSGAGCRSAARACARPAQRIRDKFVADCGYRSGPSICCLFVESRSPDLRPRDVRSRPLLLVAPVAMERTQHAIDSAASARDACTRELTHVPIEAQLLAGHHIRGGYELAVDCAPNGGHTGRQIYSQPMRGCACSGGSTRRCHATTRTSPTRADSTLQRWTGSTQTLGGSRGTATRRGGRCGAAATASTFATTRCSTTRSSSRRSTRF